MTLENLNKNKINELVKSYLKIEEEFILIAIDFFEEKIKYNSYTIKGINSFNFLDTMEIFLKNNDDIIDNINDIIIDKIKD